MLILEQALRMAVPEQVAGEQRRRGGAEAGEAEARKAEAGEAGATAGCERGVLTENPAPRPRKRATVRAAQRRDSSVSG